MSNTSSIRQRPFRTIEDIPALRGTRVIVRASLNVPLKDGVVRDVFRIKEATETIQYLKEQGARVIVLAHIGREPQETLKPVFECIQTYVPLTWAGGLSGEQVEGAISTLADGDVILLENVRSDARETENDDAFARMLASYGDVYINDAFADSHRAHASIVGIPAYLPSYAGRSFVREYDALAEAFEPVHPALFILGGAKFETKLPLVERFVQNYDHVFIGGAIANDFFAGKKYEVGHSMISQIDLSDSPLLASDRVLLPTDVVVTGASGKRVCAPEEVTSDERILDAGPQTLTDLASVVAQAHTIVWNGPLGAYEDGFDAGTNALAQQIANASARSIIGGGDTVAAIEKLGLNSKFGFISTAGGAMLQFLQDETLPGIEALSRAPRI